MSHRRTLVSAMLALLLGLAGCKADPTSVSGFDSLLSAADRGLFEMRTADSTLDSFLRRGHGYAMFPGIGSGSFFGGRDWGRAVVFEQGRHIGFADMTMANVAPTAGSQRFRQLIVFQDEGALNRFKSNHLRLDAATRGVPVTTFAAASTNFRDGVAIFLQPTRGAMASTSLDAQRFRFQPL